MNILHRNIQSSHRTHAAIAAVLLFVASFFMLSCDNEDDSFPVYPINRPNALVTVKPNNSGTRFIMQLDDSTTINAVNIQKAPYDKEVRAFVSFRMLTPPDKRRHYDVYVNWMDSILTKPMSAYVEAGQPAAYVEDPVEILREWTVVEDGYLTIHFRTQWAANNTPHIVRLAPTDNTNPYDLTFYHDAQGVKGGYWGDGIVAFRLNDLPDTNGKTVEMTLRWTSFGGKKSTTFKYTTRKGSTQIEGLCYAASGQFEKAIR